MTPTEINACSCDKLFLFYFNSYIESTKWANVPFLARLHFSAEELMLYPRRPRQRRRQRPRRRPHAKC